MKSTTKKYLIIFDTLLMKYLGVPLDTYLIWSWTKSSEKSFRDSNDDDDDEEEDGENDVDVFGENVSFDSLDSGEAL
jgi:hypothetical protein